VIDKLSLFICMQGTMSHMAPEALLRGHISKAADVYSFGITLWELFTGCHAYFGKAAFAWVCAGRQGCILHRDYSDHAQMYQASASPVYQVWGVPLSGESTQ
jgi:serine/threonine protein kinase